MKNITIAKNLNLPIEIVTQTMAILAKRRAGKSYTMRRMIEQIFKSNQQVVIIDPKGDQWGIRSTADGKKPGLPVVILGGEHGDVPLEVNAGEIVAKLVVEERVSILLDLSFFRKYEVATFMTAFLENLYRLKAREIYRTPVMVVIDEADAIAPQKPQKGEERMLGAAEDIVRRGGQRGIGCILVTQRSAVLNKNVLTQTQILVALRTIAPQDLAAMNAWIEVHGEPEQQKILMESLPSLPVGDAWFWSPGWPTNEGIFKRVHVLPIETFDSGATPEVGKKPVEPKNLADIDINILKRQMAATIEKVKQDDPKALRRRIAELELEAKNRTPNKDRSVSRNVVEIKKIQVSVVGKRALEGMVKLESGLRKLIKPVKDYVAMIDAGIDRLAKEINKAEKINAEVMHRPDVISGVRPRQLVVVPPPSKPRFKPQGFESLPPSNDGNNGNYELTNPEQRILDAIAWMESIGINEPEQTAIAFLAGYKFGGGAFNNPRGALRSRGLVDYVNGNKIILTGAGREAAKVPETALTTEELHRKVLSILRGPERKVLEVLLEIYPEDISNEELAERAGYSAGGGAYNNPRGRLRSLGLIEYRGSQVVARPILFL